VKFVRPAAFGYAEGSIMSDMPSALFRIAACACAVGALFQLPAPAATKAAQIEQLIAADKLDEAVSEARKALLTAGDDADLHMALAQALATKGRRVMPVVEANIDATAIGKKDQYLPFPEPGRNTEVDVVYDQALFDEALAEVRKAISLAPQRLDLRYSECYLLTDAGENQKAAAAIYRTIESFPGRADIAPTLASYGNERLARGDVPGALKLLGVVATAFPDDPAVLASYGTVLAWSGQVEEGLVALDRAAELNPRDAEISRKRGTVGLLAQDFTRARSAFLRAHLLSHATADHFGAAVAQFGLGPTSSRSDFMDVTELASTEPPEAELALDFVRAIDRPDTRIQLARRLVEDRQGLLAIPLLSQVPKESAAEARTLMKGIYAGVGFPLPASSAAAERSAAHE
jgi:Flp pilus assembly protein TadD